MQVDIIIWSFLVAGAISMVCFGVFMWLNRQTSDIDDRTYDTHFDPGQLVAKYRYNGRDEADESGAPKSLRRHSHQPKAVEPEIEISTDEVEAKDPPPKEESNENTRFSSVEVVEATIVNEE